MALTGGSRRADRGAVAALRGARCAVRGAYAISLARGRNSHGARLAVRGTFHTFQPAEGRRGAADYTRKKDTKKPALGGLWLVRFTDQP